MDASDPIPVERNNVRRGPPPRLGAVRPSRSFLSSVKHLLDAYGLRAGAALVAGAALGGAVYRVPTLERVGHRYLNEPGMSVERADLDPVKHFASTGAVVAARNAIPPDDTYTIALGPDEPPSTAVVIRMWLLPLRYTPKLHDAKWVIAYARDPDTVGVNYSKAIYLSWTAELLEVAR